MTMLSGKTYPNEMDHTCEPCATKSCDNIYFPSLPMQTSRTGTALTGDVMLFSGNPLALGTDADPSPIAIALATAILAGAVPLPVGNEDQAKINAALFSRQSANPVIRLNTTAANFSNLVVGMVPLDTTQGLDIKTYRAAQFLSPDQFQNQILDLVDNMGRPLFPFGKCVLWGILIPPTVTINTTFFFDEQYDRATSVGKSTTPPPRYLTHGDGGTMVQDRVANTLIP